MTTQHLEEAEELADKLALLDTGKLVTQGTVDEIKKKYGVGYNLKITSSRLATRSFQSIITLLVTSKVPGSYLSQRSQDMSASMVE